ncbi:POK9 protein, partial [Anhinga rufa]|nr:POK9 protein [Anhinga rufa]
RGSPGIDLAAAVDVTLLDSTVCKIPTGIAGPVIPGKSSVGALLLGQSSSTLAGLIVLPGIIDADYTGEIMILAYTLYPPMIIKKGTRIAQLLLYEQHPFINTQQAERLDKGFGSTGNHIVSLVQEMKKRPLMTIYLSYLNERVILQRVMTDTGADVTILD